MPRISLAHDQNGLNYYYARARDRPERGFWGLTDHHVGVRKSNDRPLYIATGRGDVRDPEVQLEAEGGNS